MGRGHRRCCVSRAGAGRADAPLASLLAPPPGSQGGGSIPTCPPLSGGCGTEPIYVRCFPPTGRVEKKIKKSCFSPHGPSPAAVRTRRRLASCDETAAGSEAGACVVGRKGKLAALPALDPGSAWEGLAVTVAVALPLAFPSRLLWAAAGTCGRGKCPALVSGCGGLGRNDWSLTERRTGRVALPGERATCSVRGTARSAREQVAQPPEEPPVSPSLTCFPRGPCGRGYGLAARRLCAQATLPAQVLPSRSSGVTEPHGVLSCRPWGSLNHTRWGAPPAGPPQAALPARAEQRKEATCPAHTCLAHAGGLALQTHRNHRPHFPSPGRVSPSCPRAPVSPAPRVLGPQRQAAN